MLTQLNTLRDQIHANAVAKGFYEETHPDEHYLALIIEEIGEAITADRKGERANTESFREEMERGYEIETPYKMYIKGSLEEELADIAIRLLDFAGHKGVDLDVHETAKEKYMELKNGGFQEFVNRYNKIGFSVFMFRFAMELDGIILCINNGFEKCEIQDIVNALTSIEALANALGFDLIYHIKAKMKYNETRPYKHGKAY